MSTRSMIALKTGENQCIAIACHFDGYPEHHGPILLTAYGTEERVRALLALGDLECLGLELGEKHSRADNRRPEWCLARGRDANERNTQACHYLIEELAEGWIDYIYLFDPNKDGGAWLISRDARAFSPLAEHPDLAVQDESNSVVAVARRRMRMREESQAALSKTLARIDEYRTTPFTESFRAHVQQTLARLFERARGLGEPDDVKVIDDAVSLLWREECAGLDAEFRIEQSGDLRGASCVFRTEEEYGNTEEAIEAFARRFGAEE